MAVRYPATVKLAIAHTESVRDFEAGCIKQGPAEQHRSVSIMVTH